MATAMVQRRRPEALLGLAVATLALPAACPGSASACERAGFRVVLDIGHTEQAPGAISARGIPELVSIASSVRPSRRGWPMTATELLAKGAQFTRYHAEKIRGENRPWADAMRGIYAFDDLVVLKHVVAPAVLLESGFIVNRDEETILASEERHNRVAGAISAAFATFCNAADKR